MSEMTAKTLRNVLSGCRCSKTAMLKAAAEEVDAHADAWEANLKEREDSARRLIRCHDDADVLVKKLEARIEALERERDLAIAHDRQPYPTAWAYEQVCGALVKAKSHIEALTQEIKHMRRWSRGDVTGLTVAQIADAIMEMCDDALAALKENP